MLAAARAGADVPVVESVFASFAQQPFTLSGTNPCPLPASPVMSPPAPAGSGSGARPGKLQLAQHLVQQSSPGPSTASSHEPLAHLEILADPVPGLSGGPSGRCPSSSSLQKQHGFITSQVAQELRNAPHSVLSGPFPSLHLPASKVVPHRSLRLSCPADLHFPLRGTGLSPQLHSQCRPLTVGSPSPCICRVPSSWASPVTHTGVGGGLCHSW